MSNKEEKPNEFREMLADRYGDDLILLAEEYLDEAIIGVSHDNRVIYSYEKLVEAFVKHDGMEEIDAIEYIDYNTIRSLPYYPEGPIVMYELEEL